MSKIYCGSVVPACVVLSFCVASSRFFITGGSAAADSDFVFHVSKLSWNTTDDTLRDVRLTFLALPALSVPDPELS